MPRNFPSLRLIILITAFPVISGLAAQHATTSPDGALRVAVAMDDATGTLTYAVDFHDKNLIAPSPLGLEFDRTSVIPGNGWKIAGVKSREQDSEWKPVWGKRTRVRDHYSETIVQLTGPANPISALEVTVRAYDDGIAIRYSVPAGTAGDAGTGGAGGNPAPAAADRTGFIFVGDYTAWSFNGENHNLGPDKLSAINGQRLPVLTVQAADDAFLAVHEADLRAGEPLRLEKAGPTAFRALASTGPILPGYVGPWRVIFAGKSPGTLVDSHLIELLNPDPVGDFSWVRPGVAVWDWRIDGAVVDGFAYKMNLPSWLRMVDFAAENGMKHLVLDANWYGPEFAQNSDPVKGHMADDVKKLIAHGKAKGVGIWLYLNDVGGRKFPLEETLAQYGEWGASGVKYGFMSGNPVEKNARTRMITELCAKNHLLCDFHDGPVHPYGQMRTWPNAVTREYCHAQLDARRVFQPKTFVTTVFVNMLAGPLDMNNGMFDLRQGKTTRVDNPQPVPSTLVSEAARTMIVFSGTTILPDVPEFYRKYPDLLRFLASQKMPWKESKTLSGTIGDHIVMARQSADGKWLVGAAASEAGKSLDIPLAFLGKGRWNATIVQDGKDAHYLTNRESLQNDHREVTAADSVHVDLAPGGGACLLLEAIAGK